jgi:lipopolysaccharide assembly outer membrane protein LptD (OstA)
MNFLRNCACSLFAALFVFASSVHAADKSEPRKTDVPARDTYAVQNPQVETVADTLEYSKTQKKVIAKGNVVIKYQRIQLTADYAEVETETKKAYAYGHVIVFQDGKETTKTEEIYYNFDTETGSAPKTRHIAPPWYTQAADVQQVAPGVKVACNGGFTSCNMDEPYYEVRAKKMIIYEHDKIIAQNVTIYIQKVPVFWLPYIIVPIDWLEIPISVSAGYYSRWGYYINTTKRLKFTPNVGGKFYADWRSKRGFGSGLDLDYNFGPHARGILETYVAFDQMAPDPNDQDPFSNTGYRNRGRITWRHRTDFDDYSNLIARYNRLADEYFLQEFFEKEFRNEVEPQSFITFTKNSPKYGFYVMGQKKMNRFDQIVEKLPQARFNWRNQPLVKIPKTNWMTYYENEFSYSNFYKDFGRWMPKYSTERVDMNHAFYVPLSWKDIKFMPAVGWEQTYYSRTQDKNNNELRSILRGGADLRTHGYRIYPVSFNKMGMEINQIRHVIEPSATFDSTWSTLSTEKLTVYDNRDMIDSSNKVRFGVENRFQTKRVVRGKVQRVDFVSLNTYMTYDFDPQNKVNTGIFAPYDDGKTTPATFTILSQEVVVRPYNWIQYELRADDDLRRGQLRALTQDVKIRVNEKLWLIFGQRFGQHFLDQTAVDQFVFDGTYTLNRLWDLGGYIRWDQKTMDLEEWQVKATRKMACEWVLDFGYNVRNSDIQNNNHTLFFDFYLRPFPNLALSAGGSRASFAPPVIGDTVAGANAAYSSSQPNPYDRQAGNYGMPSRS